jgi:hypothetical protein
MIMEKKGINPFSMVGDSTIIIHHNFYQFVPHDTHLSRLIVIAQRLVKIFKIEGFFHVLRSHNSIIDKKENEACNLQVGIMRTKGGGDHLYVISHE